MSNQEERTEFKEFYHEWVGKLHSDNSVFKLDEENNPLEVKSRGTLVMNYIQPLAKEIFPFIQFSEKANEVNLTANKVVAAYTDILEIKSSAKRVFEKDVSKFKDILLNIKKLKN